MPATRKQTKRKSEACSKVNVLRKNECEIGCQDSKIVCKDSCLNKGIPQSSFSDIAPIEIGHTREAETDNFANLDETQEPTNVSFLDESCKDTDCQDSQIVPNESYHGSITPDIRVITEEESQRDALNGHTNNVYNNIDPILQYTGGEIQHHVQSNKLEDNSKKPLTSTNLNNEIESYKSEDVKDREGNQESELYRKECNSSYNNSEEEACSLSILANVDVGLGETQEALIDFPYQEKPSDKSGESELVQRQAKLLEIHENDINDKLLDKEIEERDNSNAINFNQEEMKTIQSTKETRSESIGENLKQNEASETMLTLHGNKMQDCKTMALDVSESLMINNNDKLDETSGPLNGLCEGKIQDEKVDKSCRNQNQLNETSESEGDKQETHSLSASMLKRLLPNNNSKHIKDPAEEIEECEERGHTMKSTADDGLMSDKTYNEQSFEKCFNLDLAPKLLTTPSCLVDSTVGMQSRYGSVNADAENDDHVSHIIEKSCIVSEDLKTGYDDDDNDKKIKVIKQSFISDTKNYDIMSHFTEKSCIVREDLKTGYDDDDNDKKIKVIKQSFINDTKDYNIMSHFTEKSCIVREDLKTGYDDDFNDKKSKGIQDRQAGMTEYVGKERNQSTMLTNIEMNVGNSCTSSQGFDTSHIHTVVEVVNNSKSFSLAPNISDDPILAKCENEHVSDTALNDDREIATGDEMEDILNMKTQKYTCLEQDVSIESDAVKQSRVQSEILTSFKTKNFDKDGNKVTLPEKSKLIKGHDKDLTNYEYCSENDPLKSPHRNIDNQEEGDYADDLNGEEMSDSQLCEATHQTELEQRCDEAYLAAKAEFEKKKREDRAILDVVNRELILINRQVMKFKREMETLKSKLVSSSASGLIGTGQQDRRLLANSTPSSRQTNANKANINANNSCHSKCLKGTNNYDNSWTRKSNSS